MVKDKFTYNKRVMGYLRQISPRHADQLNAYGTRLGWWDFISYYRGRGKSAAECATDLASRPVEASVEQF